MRTEPYSEQELKYFASLTQDSDLWKEERGKFLGASSVPSLLGLTPKYTSAGQAVGQKTGQIERGGPNVFTEHGHATEPVAADVFARGMGLSLYQVGIIVNNRWPYLGASPDRLIWEEPEALLEIKCPYYRVHTTVPLDYLCQVQMQLQVCEREIGYFASYHRGTMNVFRVHRSDEYWEEVMRRMPDVLRALEQGDMNFSPAWARVMLPQCEVWGPVVLPRREA